MLISLDSVTTTLGSFTGEMASLIFSVIQFSGYIHLESIDTRVQWLSKILMQFEWVFVCNNLDFINTVRVGKRRNKGELWLKGHICQ